MPIATTYTVLLPILNEVCVTYRGPSWWIADGLQFRSLSNHEARFICENTPGGFEHRVEPDQKVLVLTNLQQGPYKQVKASQRIEVNNIALCSQVVLNLVADADPIIIPYGVVLSEAFTTQLRGVYEFEVWGDTLALRRKRYRIKKGIYRREIQALYGMAISALKRSPEIEITLSRFHSALLKGNSHDKLIDLTISLESLVPGGGEFRFRFPYFLSLVIEKDISERKGVFNDLRNLYDARSALVHGSPDRGSSVDQAINNWDRLVTFAKHCVLYRIQFECEVTDTKWKEHLTDLSYGEAPLI